MPIDFSPVIAVVPILPAVQTLAVLAPVGFASLLAILASLRHPATLRRVAVIAWRQRWGAMLLLVLVGVGRLAWFAGSSGGSAVTAEPGRAWPMDRGSIERRGSVAGEPGPTRPGHVWSFGIGREAVYSSPAIVGNRVYVVASSENRGVIRALDAETGAPAWSGAPPGFEATFSSPVIQGNRLVCGEGFHHTRQGRIVCLDLTPGQEGRMLWTWRTNSHVECTPAIVDDRVYVNAGDDGVYCLELDAGASARPRVVWHAKGKSYPDAETSLLVHEGRVYVGLGEGGQSLCMLDARTGREIHRLAFPYPVFGPPSVRHGKLYVGMGKGNYVEREEHPAGQIGCVDVATFRVEWTFPTPATVLGCVVPLEDRVVFGCADGHVYAVDLRGAPIGRYDTGAPITSSVATDGVHVYAVNQAGRLFALRADTLRPLWEEKIGPPGLYFSSPVVAHGHVFVGSPDGLHCFGSSPEASGDDRSSDWPAALGGPGWSGQRDDVSWPEQPTMAWMFPDVAARQLVRRIDGPPAVSAGRAFIPVAEGSGAGLFALDCRRLAGEDRIIWHVSDQDGVWESPVISAGRLYVITGPRESMARTLRCLDPETARSFWSRPIRGGASAELAADKYGCVVREGTMCRALSPEGNELWVRPVGEGQPRWALAEECIIVTRDDPLELAVWDRQTGNVLWHVELRQRAVASPLVRDRRILIPSSSRIMAYSLLDGELVQATPKEHGPTGPIRWVRDGLAFPCARGLAIGDARSFVVETFPVDVDPSSNVLVHGDAILFLERNRRRLSVWTSSERSLRSWFELPSNDQVTGPLILDEGRLLITVNQEKVLCVDQEVGP